MTEYSSVQGTDNTPESNFLTEQLQLGGIFSIFENAKSITDTDLKYLDN